VGAVAEAFRHYPGVIRSVHPTHSVCAAGKHAGEITEGHEERSPLGEGSPFHRLADRGGDILLIGCDFTSCSLIHVAESIAGMPYQAVPYTGYDKEIKLVTVDGREMICPPRDVPGDSVEFRKVQAEMERKGQIVQGRVGPALCMKARGKDILETALDMLDADPLVFLAGGPEYPVSEARRRFLRDL
jgi:aminoglycoside 3-N-acetyltransferase